MKFLPPYSTLPTFKLHEKYQQPSFTTKPATWLRFHPRLVQNFACRNFSFHHFLFINFTPFNVFLLPKLCENADFVCHMILSKHEGGKSEITSSITCIANRMWWNANEQRGYSHRFLQVGRRREILFIWIIARGLKGENYQSLNWAINVRFVA